jgi:hypothetical protein
VKLQVMFSRSMIIVTCASDWWDWYEYKVKSTVDNLNRWFVSYRCRYLYFFERDRPDHEYKDRSLLIVVVLMTEGWIEWSCRSSSRNSSRSSSRRMIKIGKLSKEWLIVNEATGISTVAVVRSSNDRHSDSSSNCSVPHVVCLPPQKGGGVRIWSTPRDALPSVWP